MSKHVNHFDVQDKITGKFTTESNRNKTDDDDLSLSAQLKREAERREINKHKPAVTPKVVGHKYAGYVVVKRKRK